MPTLSRKSKTRVTLALGLAASAAFLLALVYGYNIPRHHVVAYFWQLVGIVGFFILLALLPAALLIAYRRIRRRSDPFRLDRREDGDH